MYFVIKVILITGVAIGVALYIRHRQKEMLKTEENLRWKRNMLISLANDCWKSYQEFLKAKGRNDACMNFLTGDNGILSQAMNIKLTIVKYSENKDKLISLLRDRDAAMLMNFAIAKRFYGANGWQVPESTATGISTKEGYLDNLGFNMQLALSDYENWHKKLSQIKELQLNDLKKATESNGVKLAEDSLPIIADFLNKAETEDVIAAASSFVAGIEMVLADYINE